MQGELGARMLLGAAKRTRAILRLWIANLGPQGRDYLRTAGVDVDALLAHEDAAEPPEGCERLRQSDLGGVERAAGLH